MELESVLLEQFTELVAELVAEDFAECLDGQEETARGIYPSGTIGGKASSGNDVVDMGMVLKVLTPGMKNTEESDIRSQVFRIAS